MVLDDGDFEGLGGIEEQSVPDLLRDVRFDADKTLVSQIFEIIRRLIITVRLRPGQKISENDISEALRASKTPVREALIRLEDAGLVTIVPKSGTFVAPIRIDRYIDACFVRLQLETGAVRRAAVVRAGRRRCARRDHRRPSRGTRRRRIRPFLRARRGVAPRDLRDFRRWRGLGNRKARADGAVPDPAPQADLRHPSRSADRRTAPRHQREPSAADPRTRPRPRSYVTSGRSNRKSLRFR